MDILSRTLNLLTCLFYFMHSVKYVLKIKYSICISGNWAEEMEMACEVFKECLGSEKK